MGPIIVDFCVFVWGVCSVAGLKEGATKNIWSLFGAENASSHDLGLCEGYPYQVALRAVTGCTSPVKVVRF